VTDDTKLVVELRSEAGYWLGGNRTRGLLLRAADALEAVTPRAPTDEEREALTDAIREVGDYIPGSHSADYIDPVAAAQSVIDAGFRRVAPVSDDERAAARAEAEQRYPLRNLDDGERAGRQRVFVVGAEWAASRRQPPTVTRGELSDLLIERVPAWSREFCTELADAILAHLNGADRG
jgi:hypothetical protein